MRTRSVALAAAGAPPAEGTAAPPLPDPRGSDAEDAVVRTRRVGAVDAMTSVAPELDARWLGGLRTLVAADSPNCFSEHVTMLASVAQLHKNHVEAVHLFRLVVDEYARLGFLLEKPPADDAATANGATADGGVPLSAVETAELFNSLGESLLEVHHYDAAGPTLTRAKVTLEHAADIEASSIASVEANEARMLSELGDEEQATALFAKCKKTTGHAAFEALEAHASASGGGEAAAADAANALVMIHVLHARVLQLYAAHCAKYGRHAEAAQYAAAQRELEVKYGFSSA